MNRVTSEDASNLVRAEGLVDAAERASMLGHRSYTVWFTGLSGSGKSTLAFGVEQALLERGVAAYVLDGDNTRLGLNRDLGFSAEDRSENIRRVGEVCRLMQDAGLVVLAAFISPYDADRRSVRELHEPGRFSEIFVDTPIELCEERDVKGLYARARAGEVKEFSGVSAPYEPPLEPELRIETSRPLGECVREVLEHLDQRIAAR